MPVRSAGEPKTLKRLVLSGGVFSNGERSLMAVLISSFLSLPAYKSARSSSALGDRVASAVVPPSSLHQSGFGSVPA
jgi:hypothetical protein